MPFLRRKDGRLPSPWVLTLFLPVGLGAGVVGGIVAVAIDGSRTLALPLLAAILFLSTVVPLRPEATAKYPRNWMLAFAIAMSGGVAIVAWQLI